MYSLLPMVKYVPSYPLTYFLSAHIDLTPSRPGFCFGGNTTVPDQKRSKSHSNGDLEALFRVLFMLYLYMVLSYHHVVSLTPHRLVCIILYASSTPIPLVSSILEINIISRHLRIPHRVPPLQTPLLHRIVVEHGSGPKVWHSS